MLTLAAVTPIVIAIVGTAARLKARWTALLALAGAVLIAALVFPRPWDAIWGSFLGTAPTLLEVLCIVFGGILLSRILDEAGTQEQVARWCEQASRHTSSAALLVALGIETFCECVTGFGVGVTIAVPILRHLGFGALSSATMAMLGLVVTVWGGLSPGTILAANLAGLDITQLGIDTAWMVWPCAVLAGLAVVWIAHPSKRPGHLHLIEGGFAGLVLAAGILLANTLVGTPLAGAIGSLITIAALLVRFRLGGDPTPIPTRSLLRATAPYALLIGCLLPLNLLFRALDVQGPAHLLASPALWLNAISIASLAWFSFSGQQRAGLVRAGFDAWRPVAFLTACYMLLGWLLTSSGMSTAIADAAAGLGTGAVTLAPVLGAIGGFLTGSNTGANAMFAGAMGHLGQALSASPSAVVGAASQAGAIGSTASPARLALATGLATADSAEREALTRQLLVRMLLVNLFAVAAIGAILLTATLLTA